MDRETVLTILNQDQTKIKALGVKSLAVFGSVARNEASSDSDVDILVDFEGPATFDRYMDLKIYLEDRLGCRVDLIVEGALHPHIKAYIQKDVVYAA